MSARYEELPKRYVPGPVEEKLRRFWERERFFHADVASDGPSFSLVLPPPNITGALHMGHALVNSLQDALVRYKRMSGFETVWIPGTDHAGISTQTVVERQLMALEGKKRRDYSREEFLRHVLAWKETHETRIAEQLKKLGCSCDFSRYRFTMDERSSRAVRVLFKKLYDDRLIYKGDYLVNWDPVSETALADDEVEYEEREGKLFFIRYPEAGREGEPDSGVVIATTRPETMSADVAVAVFPDDERYKHLIGKRLTLPLFGRSIPVIADRHVDPDFGTGAVKITPAHDPSDYEMGQRHGLEMINLLHPDGTFNENGGSFEGLYPETAREKVAKILKESGCLEKTVPHRHRVGLSYRSKAVIEPYLSKQWFVKVTVFKERLIEAVASGEVRFYPESPKKTYFHWIENLGDWCISRQIRWGHRIPVWYRKGNREEMLCFAGEGMPPEVCAAAGEWERETDVLDTWFSSALWPLSTLGWPEETEEFARFYPNSCLITGNDILFFWVARMMMVGWYVTGKMPFSEVNLQGLIFGKSYFRKGAWGETLYVSAEERDRFDGGAPLPEGVVAKWEKMSKSKGNVIDPNDMIDLYGADAVRMALASSASQSTQIDLDPRSFEEYRNFANKIWNGSGFVLTHLASLSPDEFVKPLGDLAWEDRWIFSLLHGVIDGMRGAFSEYAFSRASCSCYTFFRDRFCAYYLEMAKPVLMRGDEGIGKRKILAIVLLSFIRLMHPFAPFITEEVFALIKARLPLPDTADSDIADGYVAEAVRALRAPACARAPYPVPSGRGARDRRAEERFATVQRFVYAIRNIRAETGISPGTASDLIVNGEEGAQQAVRRDETIIRALVPIREFRFSEEVKGVCASSEVAGAHLTIPLTPELVAKERDRLHKEKEKCTSRIALAKRRLADRQFVENAPQEIVEKFRTDLAREEEKLRLTERAIALRSEG